MNFYNMEKLNILAQCSLMQSICNLTNIYWATIKCILVVKYLASVSEKDRKKCPFLWIFILIERHVEINIIIYKLHVMKLQVLCNKIQCRARESGVWKQ